LQKSLLRSLATAFGEEIIHGYVGLAGKHTPAQFLGTIDYFIDRADTHLLAVQFDNNLSAALQPHSFTKLSWKAKAP